MVDLIASLTRGAIHVSGEGLYCRVALLASSGSTPVEKRTIAFVSAHIHCQCSVENTKVLLPIKPVIEPPEVAGRRNSSTGTELNTFTVISTIPKILVGNLTLHPGEEFSGTVSHCLSFQSDFRAFLCQVKCDVSVGREISWTMMTSCMADTKMSLNLPLRSVPSLTFSLALQYNFSMVERSAALQIRAQRGLDRNLPSLFWLLVFYSEVIPKSTCPSFRGLAVRYSWKLAFHCQVLGQATTVIHMPLWIMILPEVEKVLSNGDGPDGTRRTSNGDSVAERKLSEELTFREHSGDGEDEVFLNNRPVNLEAALPSLDELTKKKNPSTRTTRYYAPGGKDDKFTILMEVRNRFRTNDILYSLESSANHVTVMVNIIRRGTESICTFNQRLLPSQEL
ncbi:hypothetical protein RvY_18480 [Ramazzottius varieornatus]|uniref:Uncharacterized protein n=1 Tax=Ramazzottius varieornatus TaxID=947166 RepID=A0A1D1W970_RAMVA|nr:hypothetical protein RvY_18480 [Ramazzottius varieornatus]